MLAFEGAPRDGRVGVFWAVTCVSETARAFPCELHGAFRERTMRA